MLSDKSNNFEEDMHKSLEKIFKGHGLDSITAELCSILFMEPEEILMEDLATKTGYSLSAVSTKLKRLEMFGLLEVRKKPGSKKLYYYMPKSLKVNVTNKFNIALENMKFAEEIIPKVLEKHTKEIKQSKNQKLKKQLEIITEYGKQIQKMEIILKKTIEEIQNI